MVVVALVPGAFCCVLCCCCCFSSGLGWLAGSLMLPVAAAGAGACVVVCGDLFAVVVWRLCYAG